MSAMQRIENWTIAIGGAAVIAILVLLITGRIPLLIALSIVLAACIVVGVVAHRRSTSFPLTPAQTEALRGVFSKALADGEQVRRDLMEHPLSTYLVNDWDKRTLRRIDRAVGGRPYTGLFAATRRTGPNTIPTSILNYPTGVIETWIRLSRKLNWLDYQIKSGPHT